MHPAGLVIENFCRLTHAKPTRQPGWHALAGGSNADKTAVVDTPGALLAASPPMAATCHKMGPPEAPPDDPDMMVRRRPAWNDGESPP